MRVTGSYDIPNAAALSEAQRLRAAFEQDVNRFLEQSQRQAELAQALGDRETVVKEQIKSSLLENMLELMAIAYHYAADERWQEEANG